MMAISGTVQIPGGGTVPKKAAAAGLIAVTALIGVYYYRKRKAAAAVPAATAADQYPPDGTTGNPSDPYSTDPASGQTYGNEAAGSGGTFGAFGSLAGGGAGNFDPNTGMYYDPATGQFDLSSPYTGTTTTSSLVPGGPPFATNAAWSDWVIQELQAQDPAINAGALTDAIGLYLGGQGVNPSQKAMIFDARALGGDPPVAGPGRYPPNVRPAPSKGPGTKATVMVPNVVGDRVSNAESALHSARLRAAYPKRKPGVAYKVTGQNPRAGRRAAEESTVHLTIKAL